MTNILLKSKGISLFFLKLKGGAGRRLNGIGSSRPQIHACIFCHLEIFYILISWKLYRVIKKQFEKMSFIQEDGIRTYRKRSKTYSYTFFRPTPILEIKFFCSFSGCHLKNTENFVIFFISRKRSIAITIFILKNYRYYRNQQ